MKSANSKESTNDSFVLISISKAELTDLIRAAITDANPKKEEQRLLTFNQTVELLGCSASALNKWKAQGKVPYLRLGKKRIFFDRAAVLNTLIDSRHKGFD